MPASPPQNRDSLISAEQNQQMFNQIARRYDLLNRLLSLGLDRSWRNKAIDALAPQDGQRYLDVGSGTGDLSAALVVRAPGARVVGIDPADEMRVFAAAKVARRGLEPSILFADENATDLHFGDGEFDGAISGFCWRNIDDQARAFRELYRVLKPGSRAVILELSKPANTLFGALHRIYNRTVIPLLGYLLSRGEAYRYLVNSIEAFPRPAAIIAKMTAAGFADVTDTPLSGGVVTLYTGIKR